MGEWKTVYEDEVEGRWVTLKAYESENDEEEDDGPVVRVTVAPIAEEAGEPEPMGDEPKPAAGDADDNSITLDPDAVEDLEEELIEIGFSPRRGVDCRQGSGVSRSTLQPGTCAIYHFRFAPTRFWPSDVRVGTRTVLVPTLDWTSSIWHRPAQDSSFSWTATDSSRAEVAARAKG